MGRPATLKVDIVGDAKGLRKATDEANSNLGRLGSTTSKLGGIAKVAALGGIAALGAGLVAGIKMASDYQAIQAQTGAALKSTGAAAGVTAKHVADLANSIEGYSTQDQDAIQKGENLLLTFTNIRNEAGRGNDVFDQTTKIMADMSTALGQDASASAIQLGKALNDPIHGVTALQRVGVSFTETQKEQIKTLVDSGNTMGAQKLILGELSKEFGGSAKAAGDTFGGALFHLKDTFSDLLRNGVLLLMPYLTQFVKFTQGTIVPAVGQFVTSLATHLGPALREVGHFITAVVIPAVVGLVGWFRDHIVPVIVSTLTPILHGLGSLFHSLAAAIERNRPELEKLGQFMLTVGTIGERILAPILGKILGPALVLVGKILGGVLDVIAKLIDGIGWLIGKLGDLGHALTHLPGAGTLGKIGGLLGHFGIGSAGGLSGGIGGLVGLGPDLAPGMNRLATGSAGDAAAFALLAGGGAGGGLVIDSRTFPTSITVEGALDPVAVGRQIERLLDDHAIRLGRQTAYSGGT